MRTRRSFWLWGGVWGGGLLLGLAVIVLYNWLPADGATGDLESFRPRGFRIQWLLESREAGLQVEDLIVRAGGYTVDEWLSGAPRGPEWRAGGTVTYEILRNGLPATLQIRLAPVPLRAILVHWAPQFVVALTFLLVGAFVFWRRPQEMAARLLMFFCTIMALQYLGDAYNFQYPAIPWRWPFWFQLVYEHLMYSLSVATICYFALVFPMRHPLVERFPRLIPLVLYATYPLAIGTAMALSPTWTAALRNGNHASWFVAMIQVGVAIGVGIRSIRRARDPVTRAQIRWIVWCAGVGCVILVPGYILPLMIGGRALLPHPVTMIFIALIPFALAIAILRYQLLEIEIIINRTLVYGTLTVLLAGLYLLLVRLLTLGVQIVSSQEKEAVVVFISTLTIALAFDPLRRRIQALIDQAFYRSKLDMQKLLPEISARLATSMTLDQVATLLTEKLPDRLQVAWATLAVLDAEGKHFIPAGDSGGRLAPDVGYPLIELLRQEGQPLLRLRPPMKLSASIQDFLVQHGIELSVPLIAGIELVGVYHLGPKLSGDAYSRDEVDWLQLVGQQAAVAVENSRLFQETKRQAEELAGLHEAAVAVASSLEVEEVLAALAEQLGRALDVDSVLIWDFGESTSQRTVRAEWISSKAPDGHADLRRMYDPSHSPTTRRMLLGKETVLLQAGDPRLDLPSRASAEQYGWHSMLTVPLVIRDRIIGYAELWESRRERVFTETEMRLCETVAADAATAIEHARLFQVEREQRKLTEALQEAADVVSSTLERDRVLDRILGQVERVVAGDAFNIMLIEGANVQVVRWRGYERLGAAEQIAYLILPIADYATLTGMIRTGKALLVPDTAADSDWVPQEGWEWLRSYVSSPIRVAGRTVGFLNVDGTRPGQFGRADVQRLEAFAHHAATALENARLYEQAQQEITERIQAEEQLKASLVEKEILLKEIHHRVKNNLQVISSLLHVQSKYVKDPETLKMFQESRHRVRSMALVHERLYQTEDLSRVDLREYVRSLTSYLIRSYGAASNLIKLHVDVADVSLGIDMSIPCGLILNELVSNSLKHAFPGGRTGQIWIEFRQTPDGWFTLTVRDDGIGIPAGWDLRNSESLGLQLVKTLVDQLEGTISLDIDRGTEFKISFAGTDLNGKG
jgi:two-component sensor histidine kinase